MYCIILPYCDLLPFFYKYPEYLKSEEAASISSDDRQRYEKQEVIVNEIYAIFEDPKYSNESQATREKVAGLMQQVCLVIQMYAT